MNNKITNNSSYTKRSMSVSGVFYSNKCKNIKEQFSNFNNLLQYKSKIDLGFVPKAIIVPHAGFKYSGFTANVAYNLIKNLKPKRVLVIGPSHKYNYDNASVSLFDKYETPCGNISIDLKYANYLKSKYDFIDFNEKVHSEHSTETQAPFIKEYLPNCKIVEIVYGKINYKKLSMLISDVISSKNTLVVVSTDLSHFYSINKAKVLDNFCLEAINKQDLDIWDKACEACGRVGVKALIYSSNKLKLKNHILDYRTSFDISKDKNSVVGYASAIFG